VTWSPSSGIMPSPPSGFGSGRETAERRFLHIWASSSLGVTLQGQPRTYVYIDGFNFYYAALRGAHARPGALKWLDLLKFGQLLLPAHDVRLVRYFTAAVKPTESDPTQHIRQSAYLRALGAMPGVMVHTSTFSRWQVRRPRVHPRPGHARTALIWDTKEKGSDVNLATYLLVDAFENACDVAVIISDDSDLLEPVRVVRERLGKQVGVVRIRTDRSSVFRNRVDFVVQARTWHFAHAQLPDDVQLSGARVVTRPAEWTDAAKGL
jgi:uncharacterized LabA/DUF88 family protein